MDEFKWKRCPKCDCMRPEFWFSERLYKNGSYGHILTVKYVTFKECFVCFSMTHDFYRHELVVED
jgi:hypothetical protein